MANQEIVVPYLQYATIGARADGIIDKYHASRELPIPVEDIIDVGMGIDIFSLPGLTNILDDDGIVAFVNSSLDLITVDQGAYKKQSPRYRFSIAHELGHVVLHPGVFAKFNISSLAEWKHTVTSIPKSDYVWLEWQADVFARHLLVPTAELQDQIACYVDRIEQEGLNPQDEAVRPFAEKHLGSVFHVSSAVIRIKIEKEKLWRY